jgi:hypothetical protein
MHNSTARIIPAMIVATVHLAGCFNCIHAAQSRGRMGFRWIA